MYLNGNYVSIQAYSRKDVMYATMEVVLPSGYEGIRESPYEVMKKQVSMNRKYHTQN